MSGYCSTYRFRISGMRRVTASTRRVQYFSDRSYIAIVSKYPSRRSFFAIWIFWRNISFTLSRSGFVAECFFLFAILPSAPLSILLWFKTRERKYSIYSIPDGQTYCNHHVCCVPHTVNPVVLLPNQKQDRSHEWSCFILCLIFNLKCLLQLFQLLFREKIKPIDQQSYRCYWRLIAEAIFAHIPYRAAVQ